MIDRKKRNNKRFQEGISRRSALKIGGLAAAGVFASTVPTIRSIHAKEKPIKIGIPTALSGPYAFLGENEIRGAKMAVDEINSMGGLLGRKIEVITEDTQTNPSVGVRKARKLIQSDKVDFLACPTSSSVALGISKIAQKANTIFYLCASGSDLLTGERCQRVVFRYNCNTSMDNQAIGKVLEELPGQRVFAITEDYVSGHNASEEVQRHVKRTGKEWVGELMIPLGTTDYSSQMASVQRANPDILVGVIAATTTAFLTYCYDFGITKSIDVVTIWPTFMNNLEVLKDRAIGVITPVRYYFSAHNYVENTKFIERYYSKFNKYPDFSEADSYQGLKFLFKAVELAQTTDTNAVTEAWEGLSMIALDGTVATMRECDHQTLRTVYAGRFIKSNKYDIPDIDLLATVPGEESVRPPKETGCKYCT